MFKIAFVYRIQSRSIDNASLRRWKCEIAANVAISEEKYYSRLFFQTFPRKKKKKIKRLWNERTRTLEGIIYIICFFNIE